jgi:hypothetical protein
MSTGAFRLMSDNFMNRLMRKTAGTEEALSVNTNPARPFKGMNSASASSGIGGATAAGAGGTNYGSGTPQAAGKLPPVKGLSSGPKDVNGNAAFKVKKSQQGSANISSPPQMKLAQASLRGSGLADVLAGMDYPNNPVRLVTEYFYKQAFTPMLGGGPPADPKTAAAPPMDPSMMGGMPPMDPSMMGGMPPMGGGMPPMDPSMMGAPPPGGDPMAAVPGMDGLLNGGPVDPNAVAGLPPAPGAGGTPPAGGGDPNGMAISPEIQQAIDAAVSDAIGKATGQGGGGGAAGGAAAGGAKGPSDKAMMMSMMEKLMDAVISQKGNSGGNNNNNNGGQQAQPNEPPAEEPAAPVT